MKYFFTICAILFLYTNSSAQKNSIELFDLIQSLAPDSLQKGNYIKWNNLNNLVNGITWSSTTPRSDKGIFRMQGTVPVALYNNTSPCNGKQGPCAYKINLDGNETGYTKFSIDRPFSPDFKPQQTINFLFSKHLKYRLYKKNADTGNISMYTYEIKMAGKKPIWLVYAVVNTKAGNGIYLKGYLIENDLKELDTKNSTTKETNQEDQQLTAAAGKLFKNVKTTISNADKNALQKASGFTAANKDLRVYPTDLNKDGLEEIFFQDCDLELYGNAGCGTTLFIKNADGKFEFQDEAVAPYLLTRTTSNKGYPDLIAGGPGFNFAVFRWNGRKYTMLKNNEPISTGDKTIDEVSDEYTGKASPKEKKSPVTAQLDKTDIPAANNLDFLATYTTQKKDIFSNKNFIARLKKLMGSNYQRMMSNWDLSTDMVSENGLFYHWGMQSHNGGYHESMILADIKKNLLYVKLIKEENPYYFSEDGKNTIPKYIMDWANEVYKRGRQ